MNSRWIKFPLQLLWWILLTMVIAILLVSKWEGYALLKIPCGIEMHCETSMQITDVAAIDLMRYGLTTSYYSAIITLFMLIANLSYIAISILLYLYRRHDFTGILSSMFLLIIGTIFTTDFEALAQYWFLYKMAFLLDSIGGMYLVFLLLFPNGRFAPNWMFIPAVIWALSQSIRYFNPEIWDILRWNPLFMTSLVVVTHGSLLFSLYYRYRHMNNSMDRRHLRWFIFSIIAYIGGGLLSTLQFFLQNGLSQLAFQVIFLASLMVLPFAIGMIIMERGYDKHTLIMQRTLLLSILGFMMLLLYATTVSGLSVIFQQDEVLISLAATGLIVITIQPIYIRLQRALNRLIYGKPDNPYQILTRLVERLENVTETHSLYQEIVDGIGQALKLPYTAIRLRIGTDDIRVAEYGQPIMDVTEISLRWGGELLGALVLGTSKNAVPQFEDHVHQLIMQISAAVHASRLTQELQQSRERIVTAREEERRRLGRDLHDGLGAHLASLVLRMDTMIEQGGLVAEQQRQFNTFQHELEEAISDVRRLAYSLRPPSLDEFGLKFAIQEFAARFEQEHLLVTMDLPVMMPELTAAEELALYRIIQEALTNALRHGRASSFHIQLKEKAGTLHMELSDNGSGIPHTYTVGVGILSMRERSEELGGRCDWVAREPAGTTVKVYIPLNKGAADHG